MASCSFLWVLMLMCSILFFSIKFVTSHSIRIGAIFPLSTTSYGASIDGNQRLASFLMAVDDLNQNETLMARNLTIEYAVADSQATFSNTAVASLDLARNAFSSQGLHGVIGAGTNLVSEAMAYIFQDADVAQISYGSDDAGLSQNGVYTDFTRVYPSLAYQGGAFANVVAHFGWSRVVAVYSLDVNGSMALSEFESACNVLGIDVLTSIKLMPGKASDLISELNAAKQYDARVFVLLVNTPSEAAFFFEHGYSAGVLSKGKTVVLGLSTITSSALWTYLSDPSLASEYLTGFLGMEAANIDWKVTAKGRQFIKKFRSQPNTVSYYNESSTGKVVARCNTTLDSDGNFYLYQLLNPNTGNYTCSGLDFSAYSVNGSDVSIYSAYIYDATVALVMGILQYADSYNNRTVPKKMLGSLLRSVLVNNITFDGYSGNIKFSAGSLYTPDFGYGDRVTGLRFALLNYQVGSGSSHALNRVGVWSSETGFVLCSEDEPQYRDAMVGGCHTINWGTSDGSIPKDRAGPIDLLMPASLKSLLVALFAIEIIVFLFFASILVIYRNTRIVKAGQLPMMWLVLMMGMYSAWRVLLSSRDVDETICVSGFWLGHLSFTGLIALFAKTLRVHLVVNSGKLRRVKITTTHVLVFTLSLYVLMVWFMAIMSAVDPQRVLVTSSQAVNGQITNQYYCTTALPTLDYVLYTFEAAILLLSAKLCYDTKDVPDAINESYIVAGAITIVVIFCAIGFPVVFVVIEIAYLKQLVTGLCFFCGSTGAMVIYFSSKAYLLLTGADLNARFEIVRKDDRKKKMKSADEKNGGNAAGVTNKPPVAGGGGGGGVPETDEEKVKRRQARYLEELIARNPIAGKFLKELPKDRNDLYELIACLHGLSANIDMQNDFNSSDFSASDKNSSSSKRSIVRSDNTVTSVAAVNPTRSSILLVSGRTVDAGGVSLLPLSAPSVRNPPGTTTTPSISSATAASVDSNGSHHSNHVSGDAAAAAFGQLFTGSGNLKQKQQPQQSSSHRSAAANRVAAAMDGDDDNMVAHYD